MRASKQEPWWYGLIRSRLFEGGFELVLRGLFKLRLHGAGSVPRSQPVIFCFNHGSHYDAFIMLAVGRRVQGQMPSVVAWYKMLYYPVVGAWLRAWRAVPVKSSSRIASRSVALRQMMRHLREGRSLLVACEGKRHDALGPFRPGAAAAALRTGALVVPCSLCGVQPLFKKMPWPQKYWGNVEVYFHPPLDPRSFASADELTQATRRAIASRIDYPTQEDIH